MSTALHVYHREIRGIERDSLSLIAEQISPKSCVLDLGMGSGALGKHLADLSDCIVDGVTYNAEEGIYAQPHYRRVIIADLDLVDICNFFEPHAYDYVVCADVLEHLKSPKSLLAAIRQLLKPGGRLVTSIPNMGYCGLCAELITGDFLYRPEGLLDHTHLRFFTRKSLDRLFRESGWKCLFSTEVTKSLEASEFKVHFDSLPPSVARYLLAMPDSLTYQFVSVLEQNADNSLTTSSDPSIPASGSVPEHAHALFSSAVYLAEAGHYNEATKLVVSGVVGKSPQFLRFKIPPSSLGYTKVRLDPADRVGFFRLYSLQLMSPAGVLWKWNYSDSLHQISLCSTQQIFPIHSGSTSDGMLLMLLGDDPWIELPADSDSLAELSEKGGYLEVDMGWPMSADYLEATSQFKVLETEFRQAILARDADQHVLTKLNASLDQELSRLTDLNTSLNHEIARLQSQVGEVTHAQEVSQQLVQRLLGELRQAALNSGLRRLTGADIGVSAGNFVFRPASQTCLRVDSPKAPPVFSDSSSSMEPYTQLSSMALPSSQYPIDIIVPVYRGFSDTKCCIESVLRSSNLVAWRLVIINDQSPDTELAQWLQSVAADPRILLLENPDNLGFVGTVNRGMLVDSKRDVVLLNSDTEVANNWLDRLQAAAYSLEKVGSVTPFSNNATICSYPRFCQGNDLPNGFDTERLDALFARTLPRQTLEIPTAIGFCMYIRRACIDEVGVFDFDNFGKGYGEENDFCMRAIGAGWVNLHALDVFVLHTGGVSFGDSKSQREQHAMETMRRLHPSYERLVHNFVRLDPAAPARLEVDIARIVDGGRPVVLNVSHNREGGTQRHIRELTAVLGESATFLSLIPVQGGVQLSFEDPREAFSLCFSIPKDRDQLLKILGLLRVGHIHFHHLLGHSADVTSLPSELGVSYDFTAHDYYSYCPQITLTDHTDRYCGELGLDQCRECVTRNPAPGGVSIENWRDRHSDLLCRSRYVITPSDDVAVRMHRFVPASQVRTAPHASIDGAGAYPAATAQKVEPQARLKVAIIGALSKVKGADILEEVALLAARQNALVDFHLVGYAYRNLVHQPKARLTVHGSYEEADLPALLNWLQPNVLWFPAQCPETYSYTLSAALDSGCAIVAPNLGAFSERLRGRAWTWLCEWNSTPSEWLDFFSKIRTENFVTGIAPTQFQHKRATLDFKSLDYRSEYLADLPLPSQINFEQRHELRKLINLSAQNSHFLLGGRSKVKAFALRVLINLRASSLLSSAVKLVPASLQRRVKSWLIR